MSTNAGSASPVPKLKESGSPVLPQAQPPAALMVPFRLFVILSLSVNLHVLLTLFPLQRSLFRSLSYLQRRPWLDSLCFQLFLH